MKPEAIAEAEPVNEAPSRTRAVVYYPLFDYLRILLAVGVFCSHAHFLSVNLLFPKLGDYCVQVFFALSGFLIGGILRKSQRDDLPRFYFNRSTRIWIPYFIAILLLAFVSMVKRQPDMSKYVEFFVDKVTFTYNWFGATQLDRISQMPLGGTGNHFWSICVEEQFYLLAPLIIVLLGRYAIPGIILVGGIASWKEPLDFAAITLGVLVALSEVSFPKWYRRKAAIWIIAVGLGVLPLLHFCWNVRYPLVAPLSSILIVCLCSGPGQSSRIGTFLGGISYPFYLNHWLGLFLVKRLTSVTGSVTVAIVLGLCVSLSFAAGHYLLIDRPVHKHRPNWYQRPRGFLCAASGFLLVVTGIVLNLLFWRSGG